VWEAITASRRRELPAGTVGGRIAWAKMPFSSARSLARTASSASPTITGTICVGSFGTGSPWAASASRSTARVPLELLHPPGCSRSSSSAAIAAATAGGGRAVEKISVRAVLIRYFAIWASQQT
jgi:hypothetical protein